MIGSTLGGFVLVGVVFVALGWAGRTYRLPPNPVAGIRIPSLDTPEKWRVGHRAAAPAFAAGGVFSLALAAVLLGLTTSGGQVSPRTVTVLTTVWVVSLPATAAVSTWQAHRAATRPANGDALDG